MKISTLANKLEIEINFKLDELYELGKEAKEMMAAKADPYEVEVYCRRMAKIAEDLRPVLYIIEEQHPHLKELFTELLKPRMPLSKKKPEVGIVQ